MSVSESFLSHRVLHPESCPTGCIFKEIQNPTTSHYTHCPRHRRSLRLSLLTSGWCPTLVSLHSQRSHQCDGFKCQPHQAALLENPLLASLLTQREIPNLYSSPDGPTVSASCLKPPWSFARWLPFGSLNLLRCSAAHFTPPVASGWQLPNGCMFYSVSSVLALQGPDLQVA